jgi:hypothetical protein
MAEAASDHSDSAHTVDDVFQYLTRVLDLPPRIALQQIKEALQLEKLVVDQHVKGGVRSPSGTREVEDGEGRKRYEVQYEETPPGGRTNPVHPESWGRLLDLTITRGGNGDCLKIIALVALTFPWDAYSFTVANWSHVKELWPNPNQAGPNLPAPDSIPAFGTPLKSAETLPGAVTSTARDSKDWIRCAVEQCSKELAGLSVRAACRLLETWMSAGKVKTDRSPELPPAQKPIGWSRIKTIVVDQELLPIKSAGK